MSANKNIPTYDQAIAALKNGNKKVLEQSLFSFDIDDGYYIERVTQAVQTILKRSELTTEQITSIKRALHGLTRLPLRTPGLDVYVSLVDQFEGAATSYDLHIGADEFSTESGGYSNAGYGSDSFSRPSFRVGCDFREYDGFSITTESWPDVFSEMQAAQLNITDHSEDSLIDFKHPNGFEFWEWIANHD